MGFVRLKHTQVEWILKRKEIVPITQRDNRDNKGKLYQEIIKRTLNIDFTTKVDVNLYLFSSENSRTYVKSEY